MRYTKVICPTDFSEPAEIALRHALDLAREAEATVHLVHVVEPSSAPMGFAPRVAEEMLEIQKSQEQYAQKQLEDLVERHRRTDPDVALRSHVVAGHPAEAIVGLAAKLKVDLIVTATHGRAGWRRWVFGSVAEVVVRKSPCPVLVVPPPGDAAIQEAHDPAMTGPPDTGGGPDLEAGR